MSLLSYAALSDSQSPSFHSNAGNNDVKEMQMPSFPWTRGRFGSLTGRVTGGEAGKDGQKEAERKERTG